MSSSNTQDSSGIEYVTGNLNGNSTQDQLALKFNSDLNALVKSEYELFKDTFRKASLIVSGPKKTEKLKNCKMSSPLPPNHYCRI